MPPRSTTQPDLTQRTRSPKEEAKRIEELKRRLESKLDVLYDGRPECRISPEMFARIGEILTSTPAPIQTAIDLMDLTSQAADLFLIQPPHEKQAPLRLAFKIRVMETRRVTDPGRGAV